MAFDAKTKERREKHIQTLINMRNTMLDADNWENLKNEIEAVTTAAIAIQRLNRIDFGEEK